MPWADTDRLVVTEDAKMIARDIRIRGYHWSSGYEESFSERVDALRGTEYEKPYRDGSTIILEILEKVPKSTHDHDVWKEMGLDPEYMEDIEKCCRGIIETLR